MPTETVILSEVAAGVGPRSKTRVEPLAALRPAEAVKVPAAPSVAPGFSFPPEETVTRPAVDPEPARVAPEATVMGAVVKEPFRRSVPADTVVRPV